MGGGMTGIVSVGVVSVGGASVVVGGGGGGSVVGGATVVVGGGGGGGACVVGGAAVVGGACVVGGTSVTGGASVVGGAWVVVGGATVVVGGATVVVRGGVGTKCRGRVVGGTTGACCVDVAAVVVVAVDVVVVSDVPGWKLPSGYTVFREKSGSGKSRIGSRPTAPCMNACQISAGSVPPTTPGTPSTLISGISARG